MKFNDAGRMIKKWWLELANKFPLVETDEYVIMPNHFHGILTIVGADLCVRPDFSPDPKPNSNSIRPNPEGPSLVDSNAGAHIGAPLPKILQWFKTMTTNEYIRSIKQFHWSPFVGKLWQRNYYEHVIRNEDELTRVRQYIRDNPLNWETDEENPNREGAL
ncbi:MAG: hypothetical protein LLH30_04550 [Candidatus Manganitrophus sp. SA1]|nr:hypothetical protein [Candidatus Manganitrophus morganii]